MSEVSVTPPAVGRVAYDWEKQSGSLHTAVRMLDGASGAGFSDRVKGAAGKFATTWSGEASELERQAEGFADSLRAAIRDYLASDEASAQSFILLGPYLTEGRR